MTARRSRPFLSHLFRGLGWPVAVGSLLAVGIYYLLHARLVDNPLLLRYLAGHPIEYVEVTMFCVGLSALLMKLHQLASQSECLGRVQLPPAQPDQEDPQQAKDLLGALEQLPRRLRHAWSFTRLQAALQHVDRHNHADRLEEELKYLSEEAQQQAYDSYGLVRIIIWATPMMGFLGTVMGITLALARLSPESLVNQPTQAMEGLLGGLSIAFDTTALALVLSIVLMFVMFLVHQSESRLLREVDQHAHQQLAGRFRLQSHLAEPVGGALLQVSSRLEKSLAQLAHQHADTWKKAMDSVQSQWQLVAAQAADQLAVGLVRSVESGLAEHARQITQLHQGSQQQAQQWWQQFHQQMDQHQQLIERQQKELAHQGQIMLQVVQATGQVVQLEQALNENLKALAGAKNFEDTVMSLAAAVHLLSSRIGRPGAKSHSVQIDPHQGRAA